MAVFNVVNYIDEAIESVINQSFKDFELIIVDDGSTDGSFSKCECWAGKYPETIKLIKTDHQGSLIARRAAMKASSGEYLYLMDSDDVLLDNEAFAKIACTIKGTNADMVFFNATRDRSTMQKWFNYDFSNGELFEGEKLAEIYNLVFTGNDFNTLWSKVFNRRLVDWGIDYSEYGCVCNGTDIFQALPIIFSAKKICCLDEILYYYRETLGSIVYSLNKNTFISFAMIYQREKEYEERCRTLIPDVGRKHAISFLSSCALATKKIKYAGSYKEKTEYLETIASNGDFVRLYDTGYVTMLPLKRRIVCRLLKQKNYKAIIVLNKLR